MSAPNFIRITPFMRVPDLDAALQFFARTLDFTTGFHAGTYAYVFRETVAFRLIEEGPDCLPPPDSEGLYSYYIDVEDIASLYAELKPALDLLPPGDVQPPFDQPYGQREFTVRMPDGKILAFGQGIG